ncbi:MAG: polyprenyl synthetase family protein [Erysipelotrichaceae bacterium]
MQAILSKFESTLKHQLLNIKDSQIKEALEYSLLADGKRIRPLLVFAVASGNASLSDDAYLAACAIEMIHCYSLIHDDLPAMDDADYRRGILASHKKFDEATAILTGDALLTLAFKTLSKIKNENVSLMVNSLAEMSGINGMILGQSYDINNKSNNLKLVKELYRLKTGCLFVSALTMGALLVDKYNLIPDLKEIGFQMGYVFQIQDDILDYYNNFDITGKLANDNKNNKKTIIYHLGIKDTEKLLESEYNKLKLLINNLDDDYSMLENIIIKLKLRRK